MGHRINSARQSDLKEGATVRLADFVSGLEFEMLPPKIVDKAKEVTLDYIGALLAGYTKGNKLSKTLVRLLIDSGGAEEATIIGPSIKVSVMNAALCNGTLSHVVELDDGHRIARGHPGVTVISSALAVAEYLGASGKDFITAIVAGYDIFVRIASSVNPSHLERGFHTTGTCGTFAAAAAAANLLKLNVRETANALGLAGTQAAGLLEVTIDGQMAKVLHPGKSAQAGVLAAFLAKEGVEGPKTVIEGVKGFAKALADECDYGFMLKDLGEKFHIEDCYVKLYPSCRHTHAPVDAALDLIKENEFEYTDIKDILIRTYPTAISFAGDIYKPKTAEEAKFSIPYCTCVALVKGEFGLRELEPGCLHDPEIHALIDKVKLEADQSFEGSHPHRKGAEVYIMLNNDNELHKKVDLPKGEPENPVSRDELTKKFIYCTNTHFNSGNGKGIIEKTFKLEHLNNIGLLVSLI